MKNAYGNYHKDVFWLDYFNQSAREIVESSKKLSKHITERLRQTDKKHSYSLTNLYLADKFIKENEIFPFEVGTDLSGNVIKAVFRVDLDAGREISIVYAKPSYNENESVIVTAWVNRKTDGHQTLNREKYLTREL